MAKQWPIITLAVVALGGFFDALYLTAEHYAGVIPPCADGYDCATVLTSKYATIGSVPISLLGAGYYLVVLGLLVYFLTTHKRQALLGVVWLTGFAFLTSLALIYLQIFVIKALCLYCLTSAAISTILFAGSLTVAILKR